MTAERPIQLSFTKLVVDDLDAMANFYCAVFKLHNISRLSFEEGVGGEPIEESATFHPRLTISLREATLGSFTRSR